VKPFVKKLGAFCKKNLSLLIPIVVVLGIFGTTVVKDMERENFTYSQLSTEITKDEVASVTFVGSDNRLRGELKNGHQFELRYPAGTADQLTQRLEAKHITIMVKGTNLWSLTGKYFLPLGLLIFFMAAMVKKNRKSKHKQWTREIPDERLNQVVGAPEAVAEFKTVAAFLRDPKKFTEQGLQLERGYILYGPPGTGKTTLARGLAGSAGVPFFGISGADFGEGYAGQTTVKIREMLDEVIKHDGPCIVFINELDAIADARTDGHGANRDRNEAVTQLLTKVDEVFRKNPLAIIIADTNRLRHIDPAIKRPGRLGKHIAMPNPDVNGRAQLLSRKSNPVKNLGTVDFEALARLSAGMSGADLSNVANRAALLAYLEGDDTVETRHYVEALAEIKVGTPQKHRHVSPQAKQTTAVHEAGHALVAAHLHNTAGRRPYRITVIPVGETGGSTWMIGDDEPYTTRTAAEAQLAILMGGAAAEQLCSGEVSSGPSDDRLKVTALAQTIVCRWGMGPILDSVDPDHINDDPRASDILREVEDLIEAAERKARGILEERREVLDQLVAELLVHNTLSGQELANVIGEEGVLTLT
jgi:cell division protease FtsH